MKKMLMTLLAAVMVSTAAVAQNKDDNKSPQDNNRRQEMVKHRTDRLVKDYQLNDPRSSTRSAVLLQMLRSMQEFVPD